MRREEEADGGACAGDTRLFAIVLAAGSASRFGAVKQLAEYDDLPLVTRAVRLAERLCGPRSLLVAGHEWQAVVEACRPLQGFFINNTRHRAGLGVSISCGVRSVMQGADAVLLLLADQPLVTFDHLRELTAAWRESGETVATSFAGTEGPPVIFPRRFLPELAQLDGDRGARAVLESAGKSVRRLEFEPAAADVDVPDDLVRLLD